MEGLAFDYRVACWVCLAAAVLAILLLLSSRWGNFVLLCKATLMYLKGADRDITTVPGSGSCRQMVIGDSIAVSFGSPGTLAKSLRDASNCTTTSFGITGLTMTRVKELKPALISPEFARVDTVFVSLGANDAIGLRKDTYSEASLRAGVRTAVAYIASHMRRGQKLVWSTYPKGIGALPAFRLIESHAQTMATAHAVITNELQQLQVPAFDYASWEDAEQASRDDMLSADGLHPSTKGYARLAGEWHAFAAKASPLQQQVFD